MDTFTLPFTKELLEVKTQILERPKLQAIWTEQILNAPLRPNVFPHNVTPQVKMKSLQKMSLSMVPQYEAMSAWRSGMLRYRYIIYSYLCRCVHQYCN